MEGLAAMVSPRVSPATPADFWRLAEEAEERALEVYVVRCVDSPEEQRPGLHVDGYVVTSASDYRTVYPVDPVTGCGCQGYAKAGRCTHHAALLRYLGWLPDLDDQGETDNPQLGGDERPAPATAAGLALGALAIETGRLEAEYQALSVANDLIGSTRASTALAIVRKIAARPRAQELYRFAWEVAPMWWGCGGDPLAARRRAGHAAAAATEEQRREAIRDFLGRGFPREWLDFVEVWATLLPEEITRPRRGVTPPIAGDAATPGDAAEPLARGSAPAKPRRVRKLKGAQAQAVTA